MKSKNKSKIFNKKTAIIAGIVLFCLVVPNITNAVFGLSPTGIAKAILNWIIQLFLSLCGFLVDWGGRFFDAMIEIGFKKQQGIVEIGWKVTRDFSNMLFVLFLVIIAFATILRIQQYGIKQLLPKVIIIALLINFSLVISYTIIDFSNITANFFIEDAKNKTIASIDGKKSISANLSDSLKLTKTLLPFDCDDYDTEKSQCEEIFKGDNTKIETCKTKNDKLKMECESKRKQTNIIISGEQGFLNILVSGIASAIILLIAAFVLFAGGILLIIRLLFLWFLVTLVPFVFICYIMPSLRKHWQKWWSTFLSWCFFAPVYAFFVWLAVTISRQRKIDQITHFEQAVATGNPNAINQFFSTPDTIIGFLIIAGFLVGGLIAAKQFGIAGAGVAMNIGQKWYKGAGRWVGRKTMRKPAELAARGAGSTVKGLGRALQRIPGLGRAGRGLEARGTMLRQKPLSTKEAEKYKKRFALMSPEVQATEIASQKRGAYAVLGAQLALENGTLAKTKNTKAVQTSIAQLRVNGFTKQAEDLEEKRVDAIEDDARQDEAMKRAFKKGVHNEWDEQVLKGTQGQKVIQKSTNILGADQVAKWFEKIGDKIDEEGQETIINKLQSELKPEAFAKEFQKWAKKIQTKAGEVLRSGFTDDPTDTDNLNRRKQFGMATNTVRDAFLTDNTGAINASYASKMKGAIEQYVWGLSDEAIGKLKTSADKILVAMHMKPNQVFGAGPKLTGKDKELMKSVAAKNNIDAYKQMQKLDTWAT